MAALDFLIFSRSGDLFKTYFGLKMNRIKKVEKKVTRACQLHWADCYYFQFTRDEVITVECDVSWRGLGPVLKPLNASIAPTPGDTRHWGCIAKVITH